MSPVWYDLSRERTIRSGAAQSCKRSFSVGGSDSLRPGTTTLFASWRSVTLSVPLDSMTTRRQFKITILARGTGWTLGRWPWWTGKVLGLAATRSLSRPWSNVGQSATTQTVLFGQLHQPGSLQRRETLEEYKWEAPLHMGCIARRNRGI